MCCAIPPKVYIESKAVVRLGLERGKQKSQKIEELEASRGGTHTNTHKKPDKW